MSIDDIATAVREVARANNARFALLFGSYARGTATDRSDIDLIFVEDTDLPFLSRLGRYFDPLSDALPKPVETFVYTPAEFDRMRDEAFVKRAMNEGIVLYES